MTVIISCTLIMLSLGNLYLWSLFQGPVIDYLHWDTAMVTMVPSVMLCCFTVGNFSGGILGDRVGPRITATVGGLLFLSGNLITAITLPTQPHWIFASYSGIAGFGVGLGYNTALSCIQKWFPENRGTGAGLAIAAFGLSTAIWTFPIEYLLQAPFLGEQAVPITFAILGLVFGGVVISAAQLLKDPVEASGGNAAVRLQRQYTTREALKCPELWIACICMSLPEATYFMLNPIIKTLGLSRGLTVMQANMTVSLTGICSAIARIGCPFLSDRFGRSRVTMIVYALNILSALSLTFAEGIPYIIVVQIVTMAYGGPAGIAAAMVTESFGTKHFGACFGIVILFFGIASFCFPKISTAIFAATGSYRFAFYLSAAVCIPAVFFVSKYDRLHSARLKMDSMRLMSE